MFEGAVIMAQKEAKSSVQESQVHPAEKDAREPKKQVSQMFYLAPLPIYKTEKPFFLNIPVHRIEGARQTNVTHIARNITFMDIRGHEASFSLDTSGFETCEMSTKLSYDDFLDPQIIQQVYFEEIAQVLKNTTGAEEVLLWDYQVHTSSQLWPGWWGINH